jgi:hypothetical protein
VSPQGFLWGHSVILHGTPCAFTRSSASWVQIEQYIRELYCCSWKFFVHISPIIAVLPAHGLQAVQVSFKSVSNDGYFTLEVEKNFSSVSPPGLQWGYWVVPHGTPSHAVKAVQVRVKALSNEGQYIMKSKQFSVRISPTIAVGPLSNTTWYSLRMRYKQCKLGWRRSVMKGTLLLSSKQFFFRISPRMQWALSNTK